VKETGLIPADEYRENEQPHTESNYNFLTECFFMGHYSLHLGFHTAHERFMKLNQDLHRVQQVYSDIVRQGGETSDPGIRIKEQMEKGEHLGKM
jgi:ubiquitin conjugation factor E4 A